MIGYDRALVFAYKQIDGPEALTLFEDEQERPDAPAAHRRRDPGARRRVLCRCRSLWSRRRATSPRRSREEAAVDYAMSEYGALLPVSTDASRAARRKGDRGKSLQLYAISRSSAPPATSSSKWRNDAHRLSARLRLQPASNKAKFFRSRFAERGTDASTIPQLDEGNFEALTVTGQLR